MNTYLQVLTYRKDFSGKRSLASSFHLTVLEIFSMFGSLFSACSHFTAHITLTFNFDDVPITEPAAMVLPEEISKHSSRTKSKMTWRLIVLARPTTWSPHWCCLHRPRVFQIQLFLLRSTCAPVAATQAAFIDLLHKVWLLPRGSSFPAQLAYSIPLHL